MTQSPEYILGLAITTGGDELAEVPLLYDDYTTDTQTIKAGGFIYFYGGVQIDTPAIPLRLTLGYFEDSVNASNGSISFSRIPLEVMGLYTSEQHTFGIGPTYHLSPEFDASDLGWGTYDVDNALGLALMYEYDLQNNVALGVRYTNISYDFGGEDVDGNNIGLLVEIKF
ncbi:MAG: hypothetical protein PVI97_15810 [Candidatus Thiodiazotropha sp.]|jgi:hypothetical protein